MPWHEIIPPKGFLRRMRVYLHEMFPPLQRIPAAFLTGYAFVALCAAAHDRSVNPLSNEALLAGAAMFLFLLVLRLMDELKDVDVDKALFSHRPVPSGRVLLSDIRFGLALAILSFLGMHAWSIHTIISSAVVLAYAFLMFKWFFFPGRMRPDLPLTLVTHNPIVALMFVHLIILDAEASGQDVAMLRWPALVLLVALFWSLSFAWEIARKIRAPQNEGAYVTYSRLFGIRGALAVALGSQACSVLSAVVLWIRWGIPLGFVLIVAISFSYMAFLGLRFMASPCAERERLRLGAEAMLIGSAIGGTIIGLGLL